jgi:hypothetical protein
MKKAMLIFCFSLFAVALHAQDLKKNELSVSVGYMFEGEIWADDLGAYFSVGETVLIRGEYNYFVATPFGIGFYYTLGFPYYSYFYEEVTMHEVGLVFKGRIPAGNMVVIKPGLYAGYRAYTGGLDAGYDPGTGFGLNGTVAFQFMPSAKIKPFIDMGIMSQPAGGNDLTDITYSPTFQVNVGITF